MGHGFASQDLVVDPMPPYPNQFRMKRLTLVASIDNATGYGLHAIQIVRDIERLTGAHVAIRPIQQKQMFGSNIPTDIRQRFVNGPQPEEWELVLSPPYFRPTPGKKTAYFSMWEATRLPPGGAAVLNLAEIVIVPTSWGASCFSASGVDRTMRIVPLGIDDKVFHFRAQSLASEPAKAGVRAVFGTAGRMSHGGIRKGINEVIDLFQRAFPTEGDVLLRVKVHPDCPVTRLSDPRIEIKAAHLPDEQLADWFSALTCFVSGARGEGWGLFQQQAMATGRPVVAARFAGLADFLTPDNGFCVPFVLGAAEQAYAGCGHWAWPSDQGFIEAMRTIYREPHLAAAKGAQASKDVAHLTWENSNLRLIDVLQEVGAL